MNLIDRQDAIDVKAEFLNEYVIRDTEAQTLSDRSYAKGWNECNCHWIDAIKSLPSAEPDPAHDIMDYTRYQVAWLESHNDIILEPELEKWMVRMLYDTAECYIMEHPETERKTGEWIPVSERLPEDIKPVIVTWKNTDPKSYYQYIVGKHYTGVACYKSGRWYWYSSTTEDILAEYGRCDCEEFDEAIECIAWMPLPEPYEDGGGE